MRQEAGLWVKLEPHCIAACAVRMIRFTEFSQEACALPNPAPRFRQITFVDFEADKSFHAALLRSDGGIPDPKKRIEHGVDV